LHRSKKRSERRSVKNKPLQCISGRLGSAFGIHDSRDFPGALFVSRIDQQSLELPGNTRRFVAAGKYRPRHADIGHTESVVGLIVSMRPEHNGVAGTKCVACGSNASLMNGRGRPRKEKLVWRTV